MDSKTNASAAPGTLGAVVVACKHPQCSRMEFNVTYELCPACGHTRARDQACDNASIWQACMIQGLLGFDASTKPEQVVALVRELLSHNSVIPTK